ncbi:16S rRNA (guanine(966)-N(2))-methyltransferase RsmD [Brackiella oedipodis]|uniref:16S rRNA (guanine(966)-N(2))-methyltransferase RsmD n=1 Tax=Brackiella oedipodis TaxID=124225 RepID=UPI00048DB9A3|nr:16S rRNA (guanine(966)-N(2))-methyltransferase RsmD [Brackiella oedipodis]
MTQQNKSSHKIRIIGGSLKRSLLPVANLEGLRPTPDRVRESLFNWIDHLWQRQYSDKAVLDLFAGTGALGFEAVSRGAQYVQMVEPNAQARAALRTFRDQHQLQQIRIHSGDAMLVLSRMDASRFDLILLDPPFRQGYLQQVKSYLPQICKPGALIYTESEAFQEWHEPFELLRHGKAGQVYYQLFQLHS